MGRWTLPSRVQRCGSLQQAAGQGRQSSDFLTERPAVDTGREQAIRVQFPPLFESLVLQNPACHRRLPGRSWTSKSDTGVSPCPMALFSGLGKRPWVPRRVETEAQESETRRRSWRRAPGLWMCIATCTAGGRVSRDSAPAMAWASFTSPPSSGSSWRWALNHGGGCRCRDDGADSMSHLPGCRSEAASLHTSVSERSRARTLRPG